MTRAGVSQLWTVDVQTGAKAVLFQGDAVQPEWSPHGHRIAYWATGSIDRDRAQRDIWTIPSGGGTPIALTNDAAVDWNPVWSPDGAFIYLVSDRGGSMNLWRIAVDERTGAARGQPEPLTTPAGYVANLTMSADGARLAYASVDEATNVQAVSFDPAREAIVGAARDVTSGSKPFGVGGVSPDGSRLALLAQEELFVSRTDGTGRVQLTSGSTTNRVPRWSPDGARIAFYSNRGGSLPDLDGKTGRQ